MVIGLLIQKVIMSLYEIYFELAMKNSRFLLAKLRLIVMIESSAHHKSCRTSLFRLDSKFLEFIIKADRKKSDDKSRNIKLRA